MATGPGAIVTVPDPVTGGAGAAVTVTETINAMWTNAQNKSTAGQSAVALAAAYADPAPTFAPSPLDTTYLAPLPPGITGGDPAQAEAMYNTARDQMIAMITSNFASFIATYFPNPQFYEDAVEWCDRAITSGGTGINAGVEQALWERGRARILADSARAQEEAVTTWANRRWPRPPGALSSQVAQIELDAGRKLAEVNRDIAVKSFDTEIENVRFAVKEVIDQRKVALDAAGEYIKTLMLGPDTAMKLATGLAGLRTEFNRSLVALYSAQVTALEPRVRLAITDAQLKLEADKANQSARMNTIDNKVKAALAGAQMLASMASAGINAINAQASISGSDSSSL